MSTKTPNFSFTTPDFTAPGWHSSLNSNWQILDSILVNIFVAVPNFVIWEPETAYVVGNFTLDKETAQIYKCAEDHTSSDSATIAEDIAANPGRWDLVTSFYESNIAALADVAENAEGYATTASTKADEAAASAVTAESWAQAEEDVEVEPGKYSAYHWSVQAEAAAFAANIEHEPIAINYTPNITLDFSTGRVFTFVLTGNVVIENPTNQLLGQAGYLIIGQDAVGGRTATFGSDFKFAGGEKTLSTAPNALDLIWYYVPQSGMVMCTLFKGYA